MDYDFSKSKSKNYVQDSGSLNLKERNADILWMSGVARGIIISVPILFRVSIFQGFPEHSQTVAESRGRTTG